jgi:hypothetical protein
MISLNRIREANELLVSLGGEDQMPRLAATAIERSIELQHRVDRAVRYADETQAHNSPHARQMARILDGSITLDDELNEVPEPGYIQPRPAVTASRPKSLPKKKATSKSGTRGKLQPGHGLEGRNTKQRLALRQWLTEQNFPINPSGRIPQQYIDAYDDAQEQMRTMRAEQAAQRQLQQQQQQPEERDQHAS